MPNILLTPQTFTRMVLANLGTDMLHVAGSMNKSYSKKFAQKGNKIGDKISQKKPQRFVGTTGLAYNPEPLANTKVDLTVSRVRGVHFEYDGVEKTMSIEDAQNEYAKPAALALASIINAEGAQFVAQNTANVVGTPGTTPSSMLTYLAAADTLYEQGMPGNEELTCIINRKMSSTYIDAEKVLFNPTALIGKQMKDGQVADTLGYNWKIDQTIYTQTYGTWAGTILVNGANQASDGGNNANGTIITDGHTSGASTIKAGDRFTLAGVFSVHPQTRASTNRLQSFVALTTQTDTTGAMTIVMYPAITPSGQYQNVSASPADNAALTMHGAAATSSVNGLVFHKNAFAFMCVPLEAPEPGMGALVAQETDSQTGLSISYVKQFDARTYTHINRLDCLFDFAGLYKELSCVVAA